MESKKSWWGLSSEQVVEEFKTHSKKGLSDDEAEKRLKDYGPNKIQEKKSLSPLRIFLSQFQSFLIWFLIIAAAIAGFLGEVIDSIAIIAIVVLNAIVGFIQEFRAEKALQALKKMVPMNAKVYRAGRLISIPAEAIVPGDIVLLESGDKIPADGRLLSLSRLLTQEAALTGESLPVEKSIEPIQGKNIPLGDRKNFVFKGTTVASGKGLFIVTGTGRDTELGKVAALLGEEVREQTPLQKHLESLGRQLIWICLAVVGIIFVVGIFRAEAWIDVLFTSLSLAVAAIPEGLPAVVTIALATGARKMAKKNALIRRLSSVETLGCATVICSDKTGTLTQNQMVAEALFFDEKSLTVTGEGYVPEGSFFLEEQEVDLNLMPDARLALEIGVLCNHASLFREKGKWKITGDPTEAALIVMAEKAGIRKEALEENHPIVEEFPFDSERKRMSVISKTDVGRRLYMKGALQTVLTVCSSFLQGGKKVQLNDEQKKKIEEAMDSFAKRALRVLALAYKDLGSKDSVVEEDCIFVGLVAMKDPPREEVKKAIALCKEAGIQPVMVTGDYYETAVAIAKELDLLDGQKKALREEDLDEYSDEELEREVDTIAVYSRVSPEHKMKIVKAWKKRGHVVAMTGDGVNDAPAIKEAQIGISMGITGTDVTKEASDLVLLDDNFATIVNAIEQGRGIYQNIQKFVFFLLSANLSEIIVIFFSMLLGFKSPEGKILIPLLPLELLWINLITDGFPAIALGVDPVNPEVMKENPRDPKARMLSFHKMGFLALLSAVIGTGTLAISYLGLSEGIEKAQTLAFTTIVFLELILAQILRLSFGMRWLSNPWFYLSVMISAILQLIAIYVPFFQKIFQTVPLSLLDWLRIGIVSFAAIPFLSLFSYLFKKRG